MEGIAKCRHNHITNYPPPPPPAGTKGQQSFASVLAPTAVAMLGFLKARLEFVALSAAAGADPAPLSGGCVQALATRLAEVKGLSRKHRR